MYLLRPDFIFFFLKNVSTGGICMFSRVGSRSWEQAKCAPAQLVRAAWGTVQISCAQETSWAEESHQNPIRSCCRSVAAVMLSDVGVLMDLFRENWEFTFFFFPPQLLYLLDKGCSPFPQTFHQMSLRKSSLFTGQDFLGRWVFQLAKVVLETYFLHPYFFAFYILGGDS